MNWINAFLASWYSIAYALGGIFSLGMAWWVFACNLMKYEVLNRKFAGYAMKAWIAVFLIILSAVLFYGAHQVTTFERYFVIKKMPIY